MTRRIPLAITTAVTVALALSACSGAAAPVPTTTTTPTEAPSPSPSPTETSPAPTPEPTADAAPTCETIISPETIAMLGEQGWTYREDQFRLGSDPLDGGVQCVWGDYEVASDHVQLFGWSPLDQDASAAAQQKLLAEGWQRADADGHTYVTENPEFSIAVDEDGFGMTYEFGDGWVTVADTRKGLALIDFD